MAGDITFGVRLRADGSGFVGGVKLAQAEIDKLAASLKQAGLVAEDSGRRISNSTADATSKFDRLAQGVASATRGIAGLGIAGLAIQQTSQLVLGLSRSLLVAQVNAEKLSTSLKFATGGGQRQVAEEMQFVLDASRRLGLELNSAGLSYGKLAAASKGTRLEGEGVRQVFLAVSEAATVMGLSAAEAEGALLAVSQMVSKGTVQAEELRGQLGERIPGAFQIAARAMGVTTQELGKMLEQGRVVADEFLPKFAAQLRRELGPSVQDAANNTNAATNRLASSWELLKRNVAQSGAAGFITGQLTILGDAIDDVATRMKKARDEGGGFWSQMAAGAAGILNFANPVNAVSYQAQGREARMAEIQAEIARRSANAGAFNERGQAGLANAEIGAVMRLTDEYRKLAAEMKVRGQVASDTSDQISRLLDREAKRLAQEPEFKKLIGQSGTLAERWQAAQGRVNAQFGALSPEEYRRAMQIAEREVFGSRSYSAGMARSQNAISASADAAKEDIERLKDAYRQGEMLAEDYYNAIAAIEQRSLAEKEKQLETQLRLTKAESAWGDKSAEIARIEGSLAEVGRRRVAIERETSANIIEAQRKEGQERIEVAIEHARQRGDLEGAAVLEGAKKYGPKIKEALLAGNEELAAQLRSMIEEGVNTARFTGAKNEAESLILKFRNGIEQVKRSGGSQGGLLGALMVSEASAALKRQLVPELEKVIALMEEMAKDRPELLKVVDGLKGQLADLVEEADSSWNGLVGNMDSTFRSQFAEMLKAGRDGWDGWVESLKNTFKTEVADFIYSALARPIILRLGASLLGGLGMTGASAALAQTAGGGPGGFGGLGGLGSSLLGQLPFVGGAGPLAGSGTGLAGWLAGNGMTGLGSFAAGAGSPIATLGALFGEGGLAAAGGMAGVAGAALPILGAAFMAYQMFSKPRGGPKEGGSFFGGWGAGGNFLGSLNVPGADNGRFYTPNTQDASVRQLTEGLAGQYFATMRALGGTAGAVQFGLGYDTDPRGTAGDRISSSATVNGRQVFGSTARDIGRDGDIEGELALESRRMLLSALQASDLPDLVLRVVNSVNASVATVEEIDAAIAMATNLRSMNQLTRRGAARERANDAMGASTVFGAYQAQGEALDDIVTAFNEGTASAEQLVAATNAYIDAQANLLIQIEQIKEEMSGMFANTRRDLRLSVMSDTERYNFLQSETEGYYSELETATDPERIRELGNLINRNIMEAWGLLTPEQQRALLGDFLSGVDRTDTLVNDRLDAVGADVEDDNAEDDPNSILTRAYEAMESAADRFVAAADTISDAADTLANPSTTIRVVVEDNRVTAGIVNESGG